MALPKVEYPLYEIHIKSLDKKIKFRPFLVKEEKILLIAKEAKDPESVKLAVSQIIQNCAQEPLDVETLPMFDVEMIFIKLRAKSVGETVRLTFNCQNKLPDETVCNGNTDYTLNLENVRYELPEGHDSKVQLTENVGVKLKYPTLGQSLPVTDEDDEYAALLTVLLTNIEYIYDKESVHKPENATKEDLEEFVESLSVEALDKIQRFFETSPKVVLEDKVTCKKCGFLHTLHTENLLDFFL
jgi:hypothetical protein